MLATASSSCAVSCPVQATRLSVLILPYMSKLGRGHHRQDSTDPPPPERGRAAWELGWQVRHELGDAGPAGFWGDRARVRAGDPASFVVVIRCLKRDPFRFRSV